MVDTRKRQFNSYKEQLEDLQRRLEEDCRRLQEMLQRREDEMKAWEDEMRQFIEEELDRQRQQLETDPWPFLLEALGSATSTPSSTLPNLSPISRNVSVAEAWNNYQTSWHKLPSMPSSLTFRTIPWPMAVSPTKPEYLRSHAIKSFILSPEHSQVESRRRRILSALRRWHTDHFDNKILYKVIDKDKAAVKDGVARVVRCLNDMLAAENYCKSDIL